MPSVTQSMNYEAVIGLEVHVQVKTRSKMFTRAAAGYGEPPNRRPRPHFVCTSPQLRRTQSEARQNREATEAVVPSSAHQR